MKKLISLLLLIGMTSCTVVQPSISLLTTSIPDSTTADASSVETLPDTITDAILDPTSIEPDTAGGSSSVDPTAVITDSNSIATDPVEQDSTLTPPVIADQRLKITYLDVGQGDCQVIELPTGEVILIDTSYIKNDITKRITDFLKARGISHIDHFILTHNDADHIGGFMPIVNDGSFTFGTFYTSNVNNDTAVYKNMMAKIEDMCKDKVDCHKNFTAQDTTIRTLVDDLGVKVDMVGPAYYKAKDTNNASLLVRISMKSKKYLFTGDCEDHCEESLVENVPDFLPSDVLKVGHHGSNSSTTIPFIELVRPTYSIIQSGAGNSYGHPHQVTLDTLNAYDSIIYRNDLHGNIYFDILGDNITITTDKGA